MYIVKLPFLITHIDTHTRIYTLSASLAYAVRTTQLVVHLFRMRTIARLNCTTRATDKTKLAGMEEPVELF